MAIDPLFAWSALASQFRTILPSFAMPLTAIPKSVHPERRLASGFGRARMAWHRAHRSRRVCLIRRVAPLQVGTKPAFPPRRFDWSVMFALHGLIDVLGPSCGYCLFRDVLASPFAASAHATAVGRKHSVDVSDPRSRTRRVGSTILDNCPGARWRCCLARRVDKCQAARHCPPVAA